VIRRRALPPAAGLVYALTGHGRALEPVLLSLGRWGSPLPPLPGSATQLSPDALVVALRTTFDPVAAGDLRGSVQLHLPGDAFHLVMNDGGLDAVRGEAAADAVLTTGVRTIQSLVFDGQDLDEVIRSGDATADGDTAMLRRFIRAFNDHRAG
jgi:alkyl sulfatase BDS1-like metallo-beta-lactamase superfamily hydrolase